MKALILLSHGSRLPESNQEMVALANSLAVLEDNPFSEVHCAFQQFAQPAFEAVVEDLARRDVRSVVVYPLFLAGGNHVRHDLPAMVREATTRHPELRMTVAPHLGGNSRLARYLLDSVLPYWADEGL